MYMKLESELIDLSHYIYISDKVSSYNNDPDELTPNQLYVYSPYIADLIVRCGVEIEAISKELYLKNGGKPKKKDYQLSFDSNCLKHLHNKWNFDNKQVNIISLHFDLSDEYSILFPLKDAHKKHKTLWKTTYQDLKHNRYKNLNRGNIKALIESMAALYLLNIYNINEKLYCKYGEIRNLDYSFGSKIFSIETPIFENKEDFKASSSPYIISFGDVDIDKFLNLEQNKKDYLYRFLLNQSGIRDVNVFRSIFEDYDLDGISQLPIEDVFKELGKYRVSEKYKSLDSYKEKLNTFINSDEFKGELYQQHKEYLEEELEENNIDSAIELSGIYYGLELMQKNIKEIRMPMSKNEQICEIFIP